MGFFLNFLTFFLYSSAFFSGFLAQQDCGPDNFFFFWGGHVPPGYPIKYAHGYINDVITRGTVGERQRAGH